jgi:hypothetical protein
MTSSSSPDSTYVPPTHSPSDYTSFGTGSDMARNLLNSDALATAAGATGTKAALKAAKLVGSSVSGQSELTNGAGKASLFKSLDEKASLLTWKMCIKVFVCLFVVATAAAGGICMCRAWFVEGFNPFTITIKNPRLWVSATGIDSLYIVSVPNSDDRETTYADWYPDAPGDTCENHECYSGILTFHTTTSSMVTSRPHKGELIRVDMRSKIIGAAVFKVSPEMNKFSTAGNPANTGNLLLTLTATQRPANIPYTPKQNIDMDEAWKS